MAEEIPRQVGIRAGAVVKGFVKEHHDSNDIQPLVCRDKTNKIISLGELAKRHKINLNGDILVMEKKARYCTHLCKLDTKEYGLPQTRNRKVGCIHMAVYFFLCGSSRLHSFFSISSFGEATILTMTWEITSKKSWITLRPHCFIPWMRSCCLIRMIALDASERPCVLDQVSW